MMKILNVKYDGVELKPYKARYFELTDDLEVSIETENEGVIHITVKKGFIFDGRSGPRAIDRFIPHLGTEQLAIAIILHDATFSPFGFSQELANEIFYNMLLWAGVKKWRAKVAFFFVSGRIGAKYYHAKQNSSNSDKVIIRWDAK